MVSEGNCDRTFEVDCEPGRLSKNMPQTELDIHVPAIQCERDRRRYEKGISNAFLAALLVAGDSRQAEAATAHAIGSIDGLDLYDEALIVAALKAAISSSRERPTRAWDLEG